MSLAGHGLASEEARSVPDIVAVLPGAPVNVDQHTGSHYVLYEGRTTLNLNSGAQVNSVQATHAGGAVNIIGGWVQQEHNPNGDRFGSAVSITNGTLNAKDAVVISTIGTGLTVSGGADGAARATISDSLIGGGGTGMRVAGRSEAVLSGTEVYGALDAVGQGTGVMVAGATLKITDQSKVEGEVVGLKVEAGATIPGGELIGGSMVSIDHSVVKGLSGPAIKVAQVLNDVGNYPIEATITVQNDSELLAGNGNLMEVYDDAKVTMVVDDSRLTGNLLVEQGSTLDVTLQNEARLEGNLENVSSLTIDSDAQWRLMADNDLAVLKVIAGRVKFRGETFNTLNIGQLSGSAVFDMRINLDNGTSDFLNVTGEAKGSHFLDIVNTGVEAIPEDFEALRVVHIESGDARFDLLGERADLGVFSYKLEQQGNDWFVVGSDKVISPSTRSALALFNVGPTIWNSELTTLRSRMGEVRGQEQGGGWMRSYGSRFNASLDNGLDYSQRQQGFSLGADAPIQVSDGKLLVGLMAGFSKSDLDMGRGTSGEVNSFYLGGYGTWLSDEGYYLDGVLKVNRLQNESSIAMSDGSKAEGDYSSMAVGGSVEFGKHIKLPDDYFVEPFTQLSSVWIDGSSYTLDNGLQAKTDSTQSIIGKVGTTAGRSFTLKDGGMVKPYARVALAHEFSRSNKVSVNDKHFDNDLFGSRAELGAGVAVTLSERLQLHADFEYMKGEHVEQPWGANVGVRFTF